MWFRRPRPLNPSRGTSKAPRPDWWVGELTATNCRPFVYVAERTLLAATKHTKVPRTKVLSQLFPPIRQQAESKEETSGSKLEQQ